MEVKNLADLYGLDPIPWSRVVEALEAQIRTPSDRSSPRRDLTGDRTPPALALSGTRARSTS